MITTQGLLHIKQYMAGFVPSIAQSIAFGIGDKAVSVNDTKLQFEVGRSDIILTSLDTVNSQLIYKATIPVDFVGSIYEIGLFSASANTVLGQYSSQVISTFDSATEFWNDPVTAALPVYTTSSVRLGTDSLQHAPAASMSESDILNELGLNLSGYSNADSFTFALNSGNSNAASVQFRLLTDSANYYTFTINTPSVGFKVYEIVKGSAVATGSPDWSRINSIQIITTANASGAAQVNYEGIRIEDIDTINPEYVMVSRVILPTPFYEISGTLQEIEFAIGI